MKGEHSQERGIGGRLHWKNRNRAARLTTGQTNRGSSGTEPSNYKLTECRGFPIVPGSDPPIMLELGPAYPDSDYDTEITTPGPQADHARSVHTDRKKGKRYERRR